MGLWSKARRCLFCQPTPTPKCDSNTPTQAQWLRMAGLTPGLAALFTQNRGSAARGLCLIRLYPFPAVCGPMS